MFQFGKITKLAMQVFEETRYKVLELAADGSNSSLFYLIVSPAEQKAFCRNEAGWPRNDIDLFMSMENQKVAAEVLSRLEEIPRNGFPSDENPDSIRMSLMSKYQQTESEVTSWIEGQLDLQDIESERQRLEADEKLSAEERDRALKEFTDNLNSEERDLWLKAKRQRLIDEMLEAEGKSKTKTK